jgi:hypothetical protein
MIVDLSDVHGTKSIIGVNLTPALIDFWVVGVGLSESLIVLCRQIMTNSSDNQWLSAALILASKRQLNEAVELIPEPFHTVELYASLIKNDEFLVKDLKDPLRNQAIENLIREGWLPRSGGYNSKVVHPRLEASEVLRHALNVNALTNGTHPIWEVYMRVIGPEDFVPLCSNDGLSQNVFKVAFGATLAADLCNPSPSLITVWLEEDVGL